MGAEMKNRWITREKKPWPAQWESDFRQDIAGRVMQVGKICLPGILLFQLFNMLYTLWYTDFRLDTSASRVYFVLYAVYFLITLLTGLTAGYALRRKRLDWILVEQYLYGALSLLWSAVVTAYDQRVSDQIYVYLLMTLTLAAVSYLPPRMAIPAFLTGQILLMVLLPVFSDQDLYGNYVNSAAFCGMAILISWNRYRNARCLFEQRRVIEDKRGELNYVANHDSLTGCRNRRRLAAYLEEIIQLGQKEPETTVHLFMIDIDDFKKFNDTFGHVRGDDCLRRVSQAVEDCGQPGRLFRYGGEEFLFVALTEKDAVPLRIGESIRRAVERLAIPAGTGSGVVTVSVGLASGPVRSMTDWDLLLRQSDRALYRAKSAGKNQVSR